MKGRLRSFGKYQIIAQGSHRSQTDDCSQKPKVIILPCSWRWAKTYLVTWRPYGLVTQGEFMAGSLCWQWVASTRAISHTVSAAPTLCVRWPGYLQAQGTVGHCSISSLILLSSLGPHPEGGREGGREGSDVLSMRDYRKSSGEVGGIICVWLLT